jgi:hypothetical protein
MVRLALALVLLATAVLPAIANSPGPPLSPGENLLSAIPLGWKLSAKSSGNTDRPIEFVTENQSVANWTRLIAVEIRRDGTSLSAYERVETNTLRATCPSAQIYPRDPVTVSGLPASRFFTRVTQCAGSTQPESALYLVIQGKDALYAIHLAWRPYPPTESELQAALRYLATVRVCDTRAGSCQKEQQEAEAGATMVAADQTAVWQKTMDDARGALRIRHYVRAETLYGEALQEAYRMDPIHPLLASTYDALAELWSARFRPSVVKQMQEAAAAIRAKNPPAAPEPRK